MPDRLAHSAATRVVDEHTDARHPLEWLKRLMAVEYATRPACGVDADGAALSRCSRSIE